MHGNLLKFIPSGEGTSKPAGSCLQHLRDQLLLLPQSQSLLKLLIERNPTQTCERIAYFGLLASPFVESNVPALFRTTNMLLQNKSRQEIYNKYFALFIPLALEMASNNVKLLIRMAGRSGCLPSRITGSVWNSSTYPTHWNFVEDMAL